MSLINLAKITPNQDEMKKVFRAGLQSLKAKDDNEPNWLIQTAGGMFVNGRVPFVKSIDLPDGSSIRLKFVDTIKNVLNSKLAPTLGKESFLSYLEVSVFPAGIKGYSFTLNVNQVRWKTSKTSATIEHQKNLGVLVEFATALGINLSSQDSWCTVYSQSY